MFPTIKRQVADLSFSYFAPLFFPPTICYNEEKENPEIVAGKDETMSEFVFRPLKPEERKIARSLAQKAFSFPMCFFIPLPQEGIIACDNSGIIIGAAFFSIIHLADHAPIGYIDWAFVNPDHQKSGIGKQLYATAVAALQAKGCRYISATVLDNNKNSWSILQNQGFHVPLFWELCNFFGFQNALKIWWKTTLFFSYGHHLWLNTPAPASPPTWRAPIFYLIVQLLLLLLLPNASLFFSLGGFATILLAFVGGTIGMWLTRWPCHFQFPPGGFPLSVLLALFGCFFPLPGHWYPTNRKARASELVQPIGIIAALNWGFLLLATIGGIYYGGMSWQPADFFAGAAHIGSLLLLFYTIPCFPCNSFPGKQVFAWQRTLYLFFLFISLALFATVWLL